MLISFRLYLILLSDLLASGFAGQVLCSSCHPICNKKILHRKDSFEIHLACLYELNLRREFYFFSVVYPKHTPFPLWEIQKCEILRYPLKILLHQFFFTLFGLALFGLVFECFTELIGNTSDSMGNGCFTRRQPFGRGIFCAQERRNRPVQVVVFVSFVFDLCVTWCLPGLTSLSQNSREKTSAP
jgi:hypothetical protein